jgi:hypothetical protein
MDPAFLRLASTVDFAPDGTYCLSILLRGRDVVESDAVVVAWSGPGVRPMVKRVPSFFYLNAAGRCWIGLLTLQEFKM